MLDVSEFADEILEKVKENLQRDRTLAPVGFLLKEDDTAELYEFDSSNNTVWRKSMKGFRRHVRIRKAEATITITESEYYAFPPWENDKPVAKMRETPRWPSEAVAKGGGHCICLTIHVLGRRPTICDGSIFGDRVRRRQI